MSVIRKAFQKRTYQSKTNYSTNSSKFIKKQIIKIIIQNEIKVVLFIKNHSNHNITSNFQCRIIIIAHYFNFIEAIMHIIH
ncbi:hypothetical protein D5366_11395 (plasmid) [Neokomagataea tanensis]|uniref:Uncharacterized protein n=1 Tax=Neokomagataea tanensis TaxID=661191 RepID=A0A4Y6VCB2_9PROT|nr:hypothetical protein D5366_11395 [Neokomagataea tanensis]